MRLGALVLPWVYAAVFGHAIYALAAGEPTIFPAIQVRLCLLLFVATFAVEKSITHEHVTWPDFLRALGWSHVNYLLVLPALYAGYGVVDENLGHVRLVSFEGWNAGLLFALSLLWYAAAEMAVHVVGHNTQLGWRFHRFHHEGTLNVGYAGRAHAVEVVLLHTVSYVPMLLLGMPLHILSSVMVFQYAGLLLQHQQVWDGGVLNHVIASRGTHRHHHDMRRDGKALPVVNYSASITLFDHLFGTFHYDRAESMSVTTGVADPAPAPAHTGPALSAPPSQH